MAEIDVDKLKELAEKMVGLANKINWLLNDQKMFRTGYGIDRFKSRLASVAIDDADKWIAIGIDSEIVKIKAEIQALSRKMAGEPEVATSVPFAGVKLVDAILSANSPAAPFDTGTARVVFGCSPPIPTPKIIRDVPPLSHPDTVAPEISTVDNKTVVA